VDLATLTTEVAELDQDACKAKRIAEPCRAAAGERLLTIRKALGPKRWPS